MESSARSFTPLVSALLAGMASLIAPSTSPSGLAGGFSRDQLLAFAEPDESAEDLFRRTHVEPLRTGVPFIDEAYSLRPGQGLEILGPTTSGKTEILIQVCALSP